ncbi:hypothetical protein F511_27099 [Dorcoceras hygrometricum]|uniref:Uncharacterized protein n=1 Tax=Dorcoceras hygrometricum TaxID=472368 RepID=A0A2Z7AD76_9LAMI|nr:hypothetical protein F511_27099 [Dorcoceras hygrometricum]
MGGDKKENKSLISLLILQLALLGVTDASVEEGGVRNSLEVVTSVSDKRLDLLRPSARFYTMLKGKMADAADKVKGKYTLIRDDDDSQLGIYEKPLPCFGCGIGWFSDPRERAGLAASAIAVSISLSHVRLSSFFGWPDV